MTSAPTDRPTLEEQAREAAIAQLHAAVASRHVDRRFWSREQWVDDARRLMDEPDGAVTSLLNGHIIALLGEVDVLTAGLTAALQRIAELTKDQL